MLYIHPYTCPLPIHHPVPDNRCLTKNENEKRIIIKSRSRRETACSEQVVRCGDILHEVIARCLLDAITRYFDRTNDTRGQTRPATRDIIIAVIEITTQAKGETASLFTARISSDSNKLCSVHSVDCHCHGCNKSVLSLVPRLST